MLAVKEGVLLQVELEQLFALLDRALHPMETGTIPKADVYTALESYFKVGEQGGKIKERFDSLIQALDADQQGPIITYKTVFEEDREYNQGKLERLGQECHIFIDVCIREVSFSKDDVK